MNSFIIVVIPNSFTILMKTFDTLLGETFADRHFSENKLSWAAKLVFAGKRF